MRISTAACFILVQQFCAVYSFVTTSSVTQRQISSTGLFLANDEAEDEVERLRKQAEAIREDARRLEESLADVRATNPTYKAPPAPEPTAFEDDGTLTLRNKKVLVVGANGRLGSMVCRYLLRNNPNTQVLAAVHYVGDSSSRGYGRLSYEVGAEDGVGTIGAAWSEERNASFMYTDEMKDYNLQNLRVIDVELLDPVQCMTLTEDVDSVIWCATDFNGNKPRAVSGLNVAFLFRAVAAPTKGRVEIEGLQNILGGLKNGKQNKRWNMEREGGQSVSPKSNNPISFVLVSVAEDAFDDFTTPLGDFKALKRDGERILREEFPSISHCILQMARYDENFVDEDLDIQFDENAATDDGVEKRRRRINRRDAARIAVEALTDENLLGKKVEVYTALRGR